MPSRSILLPIIYLAAMASIGALVLSLGWDAGWGALWVDTISPIFGDLRPLQGGLASLAQGFDSYVENPVLRTVPC